MQPVPTAAESAHRGVSSSIAEDGSVIPLSSRLDRAYAPPSVNSPPPIDPQSLWPVRFWDETIGLLHLFEKHREQDDNINALACFSRLAQYRYLEMSKRPGYDSTKKSIVSFFQP